MEEQKFQELRKVKDNKRQTENSLACAQLWKAAKPVLLGAIGGGIVTVASGCSSTIFFWRGGAKADKTRHADHR